MKINGHDIQLGISIGTRNRHICKEYAAAGFEVAEMLLYSSMDTPGEELTNILQYAEETVAIIKEAGLRLRTVHLPFGTYWNAASPDHYVRSLVIKGQTRLIQESARWGATHVVLHGSCGPVTDEERPVWAVFCNESLHTLSEAAKEAGITILLENLPRKSVVNGSEVLKQVTENCTLTSVCFDVNHLFMESHENFINQVGKHIGSTHLSDYDGVDERHWIPGKGIVPWKKIYTMLEALDYKGPYLFEVHNDDDGKPINPVKLRDTFLKLIAD